MPVNFITGTDQNDTLFGRADRNDVITGLAGNDVINSFDGDDRLFGGDGTDNLTGGVGRDQLTGGLGADWFRFGAPEQFSDEIMDFEQRIDSLVFNSLLLGIPGPRGSLDPDYFALNAATNTHGQFVFYDATSGSPSELRWDADGTGQSFGTTLAFLDGIPNLTAADIWLI